MADYAINMKVIREAQRAAARHEEMLRQVFATRRLMENSKVFAAQATVTDAIRLRRDSVSAVDKFQRSGPAVHADVLARQALFADAAWKRVLASPVTSALQRAIVSSTSMHLAARAASGRTGTVASDVLRLAESNQSLFDQLATQIDGERSEEEAGEDSGGDALTDAQTFVLVRIWMVAVTWAVLFEAWLKQLPAEARAKYSADAANIRNMVIAAVLAELINRYALHR